MNKLLVLGIYSVGTGMTRVLTTLVKYLNVQVTYIGLDSQEPGQKPEFLLHTIPPRMPFSMVEESLRETFQEIEPDVIFLLFQPWHVEKTMVWLRTHHPKIPLVLYSPFEGRITQPEQINALRHVELCLTYTEYARQHLEIVMTQLKQQDPSFHVPPVDVLPHGVATEAFYPIGRLNDFQRRNYARHTLFPNRPELENAFIVLNANRNYPRKRIDLTMEGFAQFANGKPNNVYLYLHQLALDGYTHRKLREAIAAHGLTNRVMINEVKAKYGVLTDQQLNMLYNACDVGINTAMGEGWGLVSFEHAATGAAQIVPEHSAFLENWQDAALMLPIVGTDNSIFYEYTEMYVVSAKDVAASLDTLYFDLALRQRMQKAAYERATDDRFQWDGIAKSLNTLLNNVLHNKTQIAY